MCCLEHLAAIDRMMKGFAFAVIFLSLPGALPKADGCECEKIADREHASLLESAIYQATGGQRAGGACAIRCFQRLAKGLYGKRQVEDARAVLKLATQLVPVAGDAHRGLGQLLRELFQPHAALFAFKRALALEPDNPSFLFSLANHLQENPGAGTKMSAAEKQEQVELLYRQALLVQPTFGDASNNLGNLLRARGEVEEAVEFFDLAVQGAPANPNYLLNLGSALVTLERYADAAASFRKATVLLPLTAKVYRALGASYERSGDMGSGALSAFKEAIRLEPADSTAYLGAASVYRKRGKPKAALKILKSCPRLDEVHAQIAVKVEMVAALLDSADAALQQPLPQPQLPQRQHRGGDDGHTSGGDGEEVAEAGRAEEVVDEGPGSDGKAAARQRKGIIRSVDGALKLLQEVERVCV